MEKDSPLKELLSENVKTGTILTKFAANSIPGSNNALYKADTKSDSIDVFTQPKEISFLWVSSSGVIVEKKYFFAPEQFLKVTLI